MLGFGADGGLPKHAACMLLLDKLVTLHPTHMTCKMPQNGQLPLLQV